MPHLRFISLRIALLCLTLQTIDLPLALAQNKTRPQKISKSSPAPSLVEPEEADSFRPRLTYDLGASMGSYNNRNYTELTLGINYFFMEYLNWRNAFFYRMADSDTSLYGLDTSMRGILSLSASDSFGAVFFAGPGYRVASRGTSAPFLEGGVTLKAGGFVLGGGAKTVLNSAVNAGVADDTQFFIIFGGGGVL